MTPLVIALALSLPIMAGATWLYFRFRHSRVPAAMHPGLAWAAFAFVSVSGVSYSAFWFLVTDRRAWDIIGFGVLWIWAVGSSIADLRRLRKERDGHDNAA